MSYSRGRISFSKELNEFDRLTLSFTEVHRRHRVKSVLVAGYVAILFGRARVSEELMRFAYGAGLGEKFGA